MSGQEGTRTGTVKVPFTFTLSGVLLVIAGLVGLFNPFAAQMSATLFFAWVLIFAGIFGLVGAFSFDGWGSKLIGILLGLGAVDKLIGPEADSGDVYEAEITC